MLHSPPRSTNGRAGCKASGGRVPTHPRSVCGESPCGERGVPYRRGRRDLRRGRLIPRRPYSAARDGCVTEVVTLVRAGLFLRLARTAPVAAIATTSRDDSPSDGEWPALFITGRRLQADYRTLAELIRGAGARVRAGAAQPRGDVVQQVHHPGTLGIQIHP